MQIAAGARRPAMYEGVLIHKMPKITTPCGWRSFELFGGAAVCVHQPLPLNQVAGPLAVAIRTNMNGVSISLFVLSPWQLALVCDCLPGARREY